MDGRQTLSIDAIKSMLIDRLDAVVHRYAPPQKGSHTHFGKYYTLNPGRNDRTVGSFYVYMGGPRAGRWADHAMPPRSGSSTTYATGDVLDLIALACHTDLKGALHEARLFLGLQTANPADIARAEQRAARLKQQRAAAEARERREQENRRKGAWSLFMSAQQQVRGTPVEFYLRDQRGIDFAVLGRQPGAIRYVPSLTYYHEDPETGEVTEGSYPAMVAPIVNRRGKFMACHRTWLAPDAAGRWGKAPVPRPKKVLGSYPGGFISLWKGIGPRGGKPVGLNQAEPGQHVYLAEGIEDALSGVMLLPAARFLAAISLGNLGVHLPDTVGRVTLLADQDENETATEQLERSMQAHQRRGLKVHVWKNRWGGKDLNDAYRQSRDQPETEDAE